MQEEKKIIDIEEAKYQAQKRKEAIERAKTLQYYKTDRVKGYHVGITTLNEEKQFEKLLIVTFSELFIVRTFKWMFSIHQINY